MSRKTLLQCVNGVLTLLRRSAVNSTTSSSYSTLITKFVNQAIEDVEGEHLWSGIYKETTVSTVSGTQDYSLTNWQDRGRIERIVNTTDGRYALIPKSNHDWLLLDQTVDDAKPTHYRLYIPDGSGDPQIQLYPTPDAVYSLTVAGYVGQGEVSADSTLILVPSAPVIYRAWAYAARERGEDGGSNFLEISEIAEEAVQKAIDTDQQSRAGGKVAHWSVV